MARKNKQAKQAVAAEKKLVKAEKKVEKAEKRVAKKLNQVEQTVLNAPGRAAGRAITEMLDTVGLPSGSLRKRTEKLVGGGLKAAYKALVGRGDYEMAVPECGVVCNSLINGKGAGERAQSVEFSRREFIGTVVTDGTSSWQNNTYDFNPGLASMLPWLSQAAALFEQYELLGCVYEFESSISNTAVTTTGNLGNIVLCANYNSASPQFSSFEQAENSTAPSTGNVSTPKVLFGIECDQKFLSNNGKLYVRTGSVPSNQDQKTYDHHKFQVGLYGLASNYSNGTQIGRLYCTYHVRLSCPVVDTGASILCDQFWANGNPIVGQTQNLPFGSQPLQNTNNSLGGTLSNVGGYNVYTLPDTFSGTIMVWTSVKANATGGAYPLTVISTTGNVTNSNWLINSDNGGVTSNGYAYNGINVAANASQYAMFDMVFAVESASTPGGNTLNVVSQGSTPANAMVWMSVVQLNPNLVSPNNWGEPAYGQLSLTSTYSARDLEKNRVVKLFKQRELAGHKPPVDVVGRLCEAVDKLLSVKKKEFNEEGNDNWYK